MTQRPPPLDARRPQTAPTGRGRGLTARETFLLALLAAERARRGAFAHMRRSRLLRWRYRSSHTQHLLMVPPDLRAPDPSFAEELAGGTCGLAGAVAHLQGASLFAVGAPTPAWARELHGFGWLRHLDAAASQRAAAVARGLVHDWMAGAGRRPAPAWQPEVVGRRILSWLAHSGLLLERAERKPYAAVLKSLADQVTYLSASWRDAPDGYPRLLALTALVEAGLCLAGQERQLAFAEKQLAHELDRQILADGGHLSRNPSLIVELLLDLLPLRQCFAAGGRPPSAAVVDAITRLTRMLHLLRLGDGLLARFNGMGAPERDALATVLAYDGGHPPATAALPSGYARLQRGRTIAIVDAGAPPPLELAGSACAGCLSFELSVGSFALLVNGGSPARADARGSAAARATASHNTLTLRECSSSKLMRDARLERQIGAPPIRHPDRVTCELGEDDGASQLDASHDGYARDFGLIHSRRLRLDPDGLRLEGVDRLAAARGVLRFSTDVPFAVHFHLHPQAEARPVPSGEAAELVLPNGECWRFSAGGAALSIEDGTFFADPAGPRPAQQIVLRGVCYGVAEIRWAIERLATAGAAYQGAQTRHGERLAATGAGFEPMKKPAGGAR